MSEPSDRKSVPRPSGASQGSFEQGPAQDPRRRSDTWLRSEVGLSPLEDGEELAGERSGLNAVERRVAEVAVLGAEEEAQAEEPPDALHRELTGPRHHGALSDDGDGPDWIGRLAWVLSGALAATAIFALAFWEPHTDAPPPAAGTAVDVPGEPLVAVAREPSPDEAASGPEGVGTDGKPSVGSYPVVPTIVRLGSASVVSLTGTALRNGQPLLSGATLQEGDLLEPRGGPLCLALPPASRVCAAGGSVVVMLSLALDRSEIELREGRAVATSGPTSSVTLRSGGLSVRSTGGSFFVLARRGEERVARVHRGLAEARADGESESARVGPGQMASWMEDGKGLRLGPLDRRDVPRDLALLRAGRPRRVRASGATAAIPAAKSEGLADAAPSAQGSDLAGIAGSEAAVEDSEKALQSSVDAALVDTAPPEAADTLEIPPESPLGRMMREARGLLQAGKHQEAEAAYEEIRRQFPGSPEAHLVLLRLGELRLSRLGDPLGAMGAYRTYLQEGGGSLMAEAQLGLIRSLRALRRYAQERKAIDDFITQHPDSSMIPELRERRALLNAQ